MERADFERVVGRLDGAMILVTAAGGGERGGCLVGFHTQCSIDPPRWLVCLSKENRTLRIAASARSLGVHLLAADQHELAAAFGGQTGDVVGEEAKFARFPAREGPEGAPIVAGCDWFVGRILDRIDTGDHISHLLEVVAAGSEHAGDPRPLDFRHARDVRAGHPP
jgi:flavin reductase (DIM6/NTAB) family NADH-FMN oxidoreductase RutF